MGSGFTERLVKTGFSVFGYDIVAEKMRNAETKGVIAATSPAEVARQTGQVHICVMTPADLEAVVFGENGICDGAIDNAGSNDTNARILVDHSTTPVETTKDFARHLKEKTGMQWIDAPVSGGPAAALDGTLAIMAGADQQTFDRALPVMQNLGECTRMGEIGAGQVTKMVNQILVLNNYCILAEALTMAEAGGVDPEKIPNALSQGHAGSNLLQNLFPRMIERDYEPAGYAFQVLKDLQMVDRLAKSLNAATPMSGKAAELFQKLNDAGYGELDGISILKLYQGEADVGKTVR